jgi:hypothetical protein
VLPIVVLIQLPHFRQEVQWANLALGLFLLDIGAISFISLWLWQHHKTAESNRYINDVNR